MKIERVLFLGGDMRQLAAADALAEAGYETAVYGFDTYGESERFPHITRCTTLESAISGAAVIVLPLPVSIDGRHLSTPLSGESITLEEILFRLTEKQLLLGGMLPLSVREKHSRTVDYYEREELKVMNAIPTAEGAIALAMQELSVTLFGAKVTVLGFGRVASALARRLNALGAEVTVCARNPGKLAQAESDGCRAIPMSDLPEALQNAAVIFNTIPARVLTREVFPMITRDTLLIDLAARPGGIDFEDAKQSGLKILWALSLPGKVAPVTAGHIITRAVRNILAEEEKA